MKYGSQMSMATAFSPSSVRPLLPRGPDRARSLGRLGHRGTSLPFTHGEPRRTTCDTVRQLTDVTACEGDITGTLSRIRIDSAHDVPQYGSDGSRNRFISMICESAEPLVLSLRKPYVNLPPPRSFRLLSSLVDHGQVHEASRIPIRRKPVTTF